MAKAIDCELNGQVLSVAEAKRHKDEATRSGATYPDFVCRECGELVQPHNEGSTGQGPHFEHRRGTVSPNCSRRQSRRYRPIPPAKRR
jgi:hypothetical protein